MSWQQLIALADKLEPKARRAFLAAVAEMRDRLDLGLIEQSLRLGQPTVDLLRQIQAFETDIAPLLDVVQHAFIEAGRLSADQLGAKVSVSMHFNVTNPAAVQAAQEQAGLLVTGVTAETQAAIRNVIVRSFQEGLTTREAATFIRSMVGLTDRQVKAVETYRAGLLETELAADRVETLAQRYAATQLRRRATLIARTEIMTASNDGQHALWQQAVENGVLDQDAKRKWVVTPDDRLCPRCQAMAGQVRGLTEPFVSPEDGTAVLNPPLHPNCRCVVVLDGKSLRRAA